MPTNLTGQTPAATFGQLLHVDGGVDETLKPVHDGGGTQTGLEISTTGINAASIRENGVQLQPADDILSNLSGIASGTLGYLAKTGAKTVAARTLNPGTGITITNGNGVSGSTTITVNQAQIDLANTAGNITPARAGLANVTNDAQLKIASNLSDVANRDAARRNLSAEYLFEAAYVSSRWYALNPYVTNAQASAGVTANAVFFLPIVVNNQAGFNASGIALHVQSAATAGSIARLGIYGVDADGTPGSLILDAGTVAIDSNGGKAITISQTLAAGRYYLALRTGASAGQMTIWSISRMAQMFGGAATNSPPGTSYVATGTGAADALPAAANSLSYVLSNTITPPSVMLQHA